MDSSKKFDNPSPEEKSNPLSKLFFCWMIPFFKFGYQNDLEVKDLYNNTKQDSSGTLGDDLERHWDDEVKNAQKTKKRPSLLTAIRRTFLKSYAYWGFFVFLQSIFIRLLQPIVLAEYIKFFNTSPNEVDFIVGWLLGAAVVILSFLNVLTYHHLSLGCQRVGMRCRIACCSLLYRKLLKLSRTSLGKTAAGQLINLMSNDVQRFDMAATFLHYIWVMPIQTIIAAFVMYRSIGPATFAGLIAISLQAIPLQGYLSKLQGIYRGKIAHRTDNRVKLMSEITSGIQVIKMYAWEKPFEKMVELARRYEIDIITKTSYIRGFATGLMVYTERTVLYLCVITFVLLDYPLTGDAVFSTAQLINTIQLFMCIFYPMAVTSFAEAKVSIRRLEEFLLLEENLSVTEEEVNTTENAGKIKLAKINASWTPSPIVDTLININLDIEPGTLCCVVGSVGAGKSSLLQLLLKELPASIGKMYIKGNISYASQEPWLFVSSVRNNILFGQPYDKQKYKKVVKVCALERDFELFQYGDKTLVGERGVSLSGGQRARINLARSVYREADIYLFDDPLSAVDTHVGKHLFEECITKYLKGKTRILVTHQVQFLKQSDLIVVLSNGKIEKVGTFNQLSEKELKEIITDPNPKDEEKEKSPELNDIGQRQRLLSVTSKASTIVGDEEDEPQETQELIEKGAIPTSTYVEYYRAGASVLMLIFFAVLITMAQVSCNAADLWVTYWTNQAEKMQNVTKEVLETVTVFDRDFYIMVYTILIILSIILITARSLLFFKISMNSSIALHNKMFANILQATMRFFDTNPSGRILNRFSKDMGAVDEILPKAALDALQIFFVMTGILTMVFIKTPWMVVPALLLGGLFCWFRVIYLSSAQDVKRLEGVTRAPVFSHVSASLYGISTIRSSKAQNMIVNEFDSLQDQHTGAWFLFIISSEAFGLYLDMISTAFLALVTFQFLISFDEDTLSGNVGLVISQSLILSGMLQYGVRQTAEVASNMTSVERILQYTKLDKEGPFESYPAKKPKQGWPHHGKIEFKNTYLRYSVEDPPVLKNLNIVIQPAEKVGIVGRTGAGKSSLISALFRLAPIDGTVTIDDVDTQEIGLNDLRASISIIPQEPVLFSATLRYNLDPFEKCDDDTLWKALENVELKDVVDDLNQRVSEGGANFSAGQRQLVCLARAIVRNNKVLIMDEATANVDPQTDALIQTTIRNKFKYCTVLTIAHRLNTVMDYDKVLVMDAGQAMEFDHPHLLLQIPDGYFTKMVQQTGPVMEAKLRKIAENDYKSKYLEKKYELTNHVSDTESVQGSVENLNEYRE